MTGERDSESTPKPASRANRPRPALPAVSPEEYASFIGEIELQAIWLQEAHVTNNVGPQTPEQAILRFESEACWEPSTDGFRAFHRHHVFFETTDDLLAEVDITFGLDFSSGMQLTDEIFRIFQEVNLPVNTWPYLREYVATSMSRMGWVPFTIPAFKTGVSRRTSSRSRKARPRKPGSIQPEAQNESENR